MAAVDLTTLAYVKRAVEITGTGSDTLIPDCITAASRAINHRYDRELTPKADAAPRRIRASVRESGRRRFVDLAPWDLRGNPTSVTLDPGGAGAQVLVLDVDYTLLPVGGHRVTGTNMLLELARDLDIESAFTDRFGFIRLDIVGNWGAWATTDVPEDVQRACAVTVASWIDRAVAEYVDEDGGEHSPQIRPGAEQSWAIPGKAHSLLCGAGIPRMTSV